MPLLLQAALLAVLGAPEEDDFGPDWDDSEAADDAADLDHRLDGYALPSIVDLEDVTVGLEFHGMEGVGEVSTPAVLRAMGEVSHPLDAEIRDLSISIAILPNKEADRAYARLTAPPLSLTEEELAAELPRPIVTAGEGEVVVEQLETGARASLELERDIGEQLLDASRLPGYMLVVDRYSLELPTAQDIVQILEHGGTADLAAVAEWAASFQDERVEFSPDERALVMAGVLSGFRRLRSPPALGDLQRLMALDRLVQAVAGPDQLEPILKLERPIKILHAAALLAYDGSLHEEAMLGIPVHAMDRLPARSDFLVAPDLALSTLRPAVLDRLLALAFDPTDFRDAPRSAPRRSRLRREASELLAPLSTTDVHGVLEAAADENVQREALRFYVQVRHAPVVEPLVAWLIAHPDAFDDLGRQSVKELPAAMLPALMRAYVDPAEPEHRALLRNYLEVMPVELAPQLLEMLRALGLDVSPFVNEGIVDVVAALDAFEQAEAQLDRHRSTELVTRITDNGVEPSTLRSSVSAISRLAQLDPIAIEENADVVMEVLGAAAWEFDEESPAERTKAIGLFEQLPFGRRAADAKRAAVLVHARLAERHGETSEALALLEEHDPELAEAQVRTLWIEIAERGFETRLDAGSFALAEEIIASAETLTPDEIDTEELRRRLKWRRYRAAIVVGAIFGLVLLATVIGLVLRAAMTGLARWKAARAEIHRLIRRQQDAEASAIPVELAEDPAVEPDAPTRVIDAPIDPAPVAEDEPVAKADEAVAKADEPVAPREVVPVELVAAAPEIDAADLDPATARELETSHDSDPFGEPDPFSERDEPKGFENVSDDLAGDEPLNDEGKLVS